MVTKSPEDRVVPLPNGLSMAHKRWPVSSFNPFENYAQVKMGSSSPMFGATIPKKNTVKKNTMLDFPKTNSSPPEHRQFDPKGRLNHLPTIQDEKSVRCYVSFR